MRYSVIVAIVAIVVIISSVIGSEKPKWNSPKFVPVPNSVFEVKDEHHELSQVKHAIDIEKTKTINRMNLYDFKSLLSYFRTELGFTSNKIEGNSLTEEEVTHLIETENVSGGKPLHDFLEVKCHDTALKVVFGAALKGLSLDINNIQFIQSLHKVCSPPQLEINDPKPGVLKERANHVRAVNPHNGEKCLVKFVSPKDVPFEIDKLLKWCAENEGKCDMLEFVTIFHYNFVRVHPFEDTNGRTVRLMMCLYLLRNGYPPFAIDPSECEEYFRVLTVANFDDNLLPLAKFLGRSMLKTWNKVLKDLPEP